MKPCKPRVDRIWSTTSLHRLVTGTNTECRSSTSANVIVSSHYYITGSMAWMYLLYLDSRVARIRDHLFSSTNTFVVNEHVFVDGIFCFGSSTIYSSPPRKTSFTFWVKFVRNTGSGWANGGETQNHRQQSENARGDWVSTFQRWRR